MKISTKGRYALRMMVELAMNQTGNPMSLKDIAANQNISEKYLEQIISVLNKAGYVNSVRGAQGGYSLRKSASEYTVGMVLRLTEGDLSPVACVEEGAPVCERMAACPTYPVWKKLNEAINGVVDHITIQDLLDWQSEKNGNYFI